MREKAEKKDILLRANLLFFALMLLSFLCLFLPFPGIIVFSAGVPLFSIFTIAMSFLNMKQHQKAAVFFIIVSLALLVGILAPFAG